MAKDQSDYRAGRPSKTTAPSDSVIEGVSLHKAIAMGGHPEVEAKGKGVVEQNSKGHFQRKK